MPQRDVRHGTGLPVVVGVGSVLALTVGLVVALVPVVRGTPARSVDRRSAAATTLVPPSRRG